MKTCQYIFMTFKKTLKICQDYSRPFKMFHMLHKHFQNFQNYKKHFKIFKNFSILLKYFRNLTHLCTIFLLVYITTLFSFQLQQIIRNICGRQWGTNVPDNGEQMCHTMGSNCARQVVTRV